MKVLVLAAGIGALVACSQPPAQSPVAEPAEVATVTPAPSGSLPAGGSDPAAAQPSPTATLDVSTPPVALPVTSLRGDWRAVAINGEPITPGMGGGVILNIGRDRIEFDNCQQVTWGYTLVDGRLETRRVPAITIDIRPKPLPCAASFPPPVARMVEALDGVERVDPAGNGGVTIKGSAGRLSLEPVR